MHSCGPGVAGTLMEEAGGYPPRGQPCQGSPIIPPGGRGRKLLLMGLSAARPP